MKFDDLREEVIYKIEDLRYQLNDGMSLKMYRRTFEASECSLINALMDELLDRMDRVDWSGYEKKD